MPFKIPAQKGDEYTINVNLKTSKLVKAEEHKTETVTIERLKLREIPGVMRKMGWDTSAALMERWFNAPAFVCTKEVIDNYYHNPLSIEPEHFDDQIVKMDWYLKYPGMLEKVQELLRTTITSNSKKLLMKRLTEANIKKDGGILCPANPESARELNAVCQIQRKFIETPLLEMSDIHGALGDYSLQLAVIGVLRVPASGNAYFEVQKIGVYIKDVFEFNEFFQPLGVWSKEKCYNMDELIGDSYAAMYPPYNYVPPKEISEPAFQVFNSDFRAWRDKYKMGGDFIIYSDVKWFPPKEKYIQFTPDEVKQYLTIGN